MFMPCAYSVAGDGLCDRIQRQNSEETKDRLLQVRGGTAGDISCFGKPAGDFVLSMKNEQMHTLVIADAQTGRKIASYDDPSGAGTSFACFSANEGVFTFLKLGAGNELGVIRPEPQ